MSHCGDQHLRDGSADMRLGVDPTSEAIDISTRVPRIQLDNPIDVSRLVIAIEFGKDGTGYALQWRAEYITDPLRVHCNIRWQAERPPSYKTPTCLLLKPDKTLGEFGYEAEKIFGQLGVEDSDQYCDEKQDDWYFLRNFNMMLYHVEEINDSTPIEASGGKSLPAIVVFSKAIEYMKKHALVHLENNGVPYLESDTKWVITVPAIWNDQAKQMMRSSAVKAGIKNENLLMAFEPECAAIYCSAVPKEQLNDVYVPGATVMVVDMGGGTVDITTVQIQDSYNMKQIYMSGGGTLGSMKVDQKFQMLLRDMVGDDVMNEFASDNPLDVYDLLTEFESKTREVKHPTDHNANEPIRIKLPRSLQDCCEKKTAKQIRELLQGRNDVKFAFGRLSVNINVIRGFFTETVGEIIKYVDTVLQNLEHVGQRIDSLILVGCFAESNFVVHCIREGLKHRDIPVVRPPSTELAVLYGAVLLGQNEKKIFKK